MKILLIEPAKPAITLGGEDVFLFEPLALEQLAAAVTKNHDVRIHDQRLQKDIETVITEFRPDIVGITAYTVHAGVVKQLFEKVKQWDSEILTVVGGHHASVVPDDFRSPFIDLIVIGEGVVPFKEIVRRREKKQGFEGIPGVAFTNKDKFVIQPPIPIMDLDTLPLADRNLTAKYRKEYYSEYMKPLASLRTSKGCPYRCNFCALWKLTGGRYIKRAPVRILEELANIEEPFVFFADDESLVDKGRMLALARLIKEAGIRKRYFLYGRSDTIAKHPQLIEAWKDVGLERVFIGFESFRDKDLEAIRKGSTINDNAKAAGILNQLGIDIYASFIVRPDYDKQDFANLKDYCHKLNLCFASFAVLTPLPGTDFYAEVRNQLITNDYAYFDFIHTLLPTNLPLEEFYEQYYRLYRTAIPFKNAISFIWKYPMKEIPGLLVKSYRIYHKIRVAHRDYP